MSAIYLVCKTTGYGNYHTPVYLETSYEEANKMANKLKALYDRIRMLNKQNIYDCNIASIWKIDVDYYHYPSRDDIGSIYKRKPMFLITDLDHYIKLYSEKDEWLANKHHEEDKQYSWYNSKLFKIDIKAEIKALEDEIDELEGDDW